MSTDTLKDFVEARLRAYDPLIDLTPGSPAEEQVVIPIVSRFQPDPLEMDVETFITARLNQELPDVNTAEGTGVKDLLVKPDQILIDPILREIQLIKQGQSLANPELLADAEADALIANYFITRNLGGLSRGRARLYFNAPVAINITIGNVCYTADGHRYLPTTLQSISAEAMLFNSSGNLYYFDINVTAESAGVDYNIAPGFIVGITNLSVAVRVTNLSAFTGGLVSEATGDLVARAQQSITERSLVVPRGTIARLQDQFNDMTQIQVIGAGDPEMQRDLVTGGDLGPVLLTGSDGLAVDDGLGGTTTTKFRTAFGDFTSAFPLGAVTTGYLQVNMIAQGGDGQVNTSYLTEFVSPLAKFTSTDIGSVLVLVKASHAANMGMFKISGMGTHANSVFLQTLSLATWAGVVETGISWVLLRGQAEYPIEEVLSNQELRVTGAMPVSPSPVSWTLRKKELTISNIPGGIVFGDQANTMPSNEVHIGGCTDFYVRGAGTSALVQEIPNIVDEAPLVSSETGTVEAAAPLYLFDTNVDFVAMGVRPGMYLHVKASQVTSPSNMGTYTIARVGVGPDGLIGGTWSGHYIQLQKAVPFPNTTSNDVVVYVIQASVNVDLVAPKNIRGAGDTGTTVQLSNVFTTTDSIDFQAIGVAAGDVLRILDGADVGDYAVTAVAGTGNTDLILSRTTLHSTVGVRWEVFLALTGITLPLVKIDTVDLLDGGHSPTGVTIPYADPVDARSTAFVNNGHGTKLTVTDVRVGIIGTVDLALATYPLATSTLVVSVGSSTYTVALTGAVNAVDVVNKINAVVPSLARTIQAPGSTGGTALYLSLGSSDQYVSVVANVPTVGLVLGDSSDQVISPDAHIVWTDSSYDLQAGSDVVTITAGEDVGSFYLSSVQSNRLEAIGFDEKAKTIRFLTPCLGVSLSIGSRSLGKARVYFLEPTSFEVTGSYRPALNAALASSSAALLPGESLGAYEDSFSYFTLQGTGQRFIPDPALSYTVLPKAGVKIPNNLTLSGDPYPFSSTYRLATSEQSPSGDLGKGSRDASYDFLSLGLAVGDLIDITYQPIQGTTNVTSTYASFATRTLTLKVDGKVTTFTFTAPASVQEIADQINTAVGSTIAFIETIVAANYIRLEADVSIVVVSGTALTLMGMGTGLTPTDNKSYAADYGPYRVFALSSMQVGHEANPNQIMLVDRNGNSPIGPPALYSKQAHHFVVRRAGVQRIHSTAMAKNIENGLYYMDVELLSEGSGDVWNIPEGQVLTITGHKSDGYRLIVVDPNLSYSTQEQVSMQISNTILAVGQSDDQSAATNLSSTNIQVNYQQSPLVASIQSFAAAELDRVLTASILVRHLQPAYVNFVMNYSGGSSADVVTADVDAYLIGLSPNDRVESSAIQKTATMRGATFVTSPITLFAVTYDENRKIIVDRSTNYVTHSRLSTFFSGTIAITQS